MDESEKDVFVFDVDDTLFQTNMTHMACVMFVFSICYTKQTIWRHTEVGDAEWTGYQQPNKSNTIAVLQMIHLLITENNE